MGERRDGLTARAPVVVTLTTDFGVSDWYAGALRGAVLARAPRAVVVDITHDVPPFDVAAGAFHLAAACPAFPAGTVHVAVVDPGVGGARRPLALAAGGHYLVGPDNGVLSRAAARLGDGGEVRGVVLDPARAGAGARMGATFHGRDLFAPAAGALADGGALDDLGAPCGDWVALPDLTPRPAGPGAVDATILHVDRYGNLVTNLRAADAPRPTLEAVVDGQVVRGASAYEAVARGEPLLVEGGSGYVELAVREGRADETFRLSRGSILRVHIR